MVAMPAHGVNFLCIITALCLEAVAIHTLLGLTQVTRP